jgi:hypothetical protein
MTPITRVKASAGYMVVFSLVGPDGTQRIGPQTAAIVLRVVFGSRERTARYDLVPYHSSAP